MSCDRTVITKAEIKKVPHRGWGERFVTGIVYVFPNGHLHDSGFMCMDFVGVKPDGERVRFGGGCDSVAFQGSHFCMECMADGTIRIFNHLGFTVSEDLSTIMFYEKGASNEKELSEGIYRRA